MFHPLGTPPTLPTLFLIPRFLSIFSVVVGLDELVARCHAPPAPPAKASADPRSPWPVSRERRDKWPPTFAPHFRSRLAPGSQAISRSESHANLALLNAAPPGASRPDCPFAAHLARPCSPTYFLCVGLQLQAPSRALYLCELHTAKIPGCVLLPMTTHGRDSLSSAPRRGWTAPASTNGHLVIARATPAPRACVGSTPARTTRARGWSIRGRAPWSPSQRRIVDLRGEISPAMAIDASRPPMSSSFTLSQTRSRSAPSRARARRGHHGRRPACRESAAPSPGPRPTRHKRETQGEQPSQHRSFHSDAPLHSCPGMIPVVNRLNFLSLPRTYVTSWTAPGRRWA